MFALVLTPGFILALALAVLAPFVVGALRRGRVRVLAARPPESGLLALPFPERGDATSGRLGVASELGLGVGTARDGAFSDDLFAGAKRAPLPARQPRHRGARSRKQAGQGALGSHIGGAGLPAAMLASIARLRLAKASALDLSSAW